MEDYNWDRELWGLMALDHQAEVDDEAVDDFLKRAKRDDVPVTLPRWQLRDAMIGKCKFCRKRPFQFKFHHLQRLDTRGDFSASNYIAVCEECTTPDLAAGLIISKPRIGATQPTRQFPAR